MKKAILTVEEIESIRRAALRTFDYIAGDTLQLMQECEGRSYIKQAEVIEMVIDADRLVSIGGISTELNERLYAMPTAAQNKLFRSFFPCKRYS